MGCHIKSRIAKRFPRGTDFDTYEYPGGSMSGFGQDCLHVLALERAGSRP